MVIPLGDRFNQTVHLIIKKNGKLIDKELKPTLFVPMTGRPRASREPKSKPAPVPSQSARIEGSKPFDGEPSSTESPARGRSSC